jgi:hypothetical protein
MAQRSFLAIVFLVCCSTRSNLPHASGVALGARVPCRLANGELYVIAAAQTAPGCEVTVNGIRYFVASIDHRHVAYVSTRDPLFATPEGVRVGDSLSDVRGKGGSVVLPETGWRFFSRLPSGWNTVFAGIPSTEATEPTSGEVVEFFLRE